MWISVLGKTGWMLTNNNALADVLVCQSEVEQRISETIDRVVRVSFHKKNRLERWSQEQFILYPEFDTSFNIFSKRVLF